MKLFLAFALAVTAGMARADVDCKEKRKAMHTQRQEHRNCNKAWQDSMRGNAADPSDDCVAKQTAFVEAMKAYKACRRESKIAK